MTSAVYPGFLSADYDKNGRRDIAAVFAGEMRFGEPPKLGGIAILLQSADSVFDEPLIFPLDGIPIFMAQEDYNEDGNLDLAVNRIQPGFMGALPSCSATATVHSGREGSCRSSSPAGP